MSFEEDVKICSEIFSEVGLEEMIEEKKQKIKESEKEYQDVCEGKKYNPLCKEEWKKQIQQDISEYKNDILNYEAALEIKRKNAI